MIVPSFFGEYATEPAIQALVDNSLETLQAKSLWRGYLDEDMPQWSLSFEQVIGRARIEAAASIVDIDSPAPMRTNNKLEKYFGAIPSIKEKFLMKQSELRDLLALTNSQLLGGNAAVQGLIRKLYDHISMAATAGDKRIDILLMQALSTLSFTIDENTNPDGVHTGVVDLLPQSYQLQGVPVVWSDPASKPIDNIEDFAEYIATHFGRGFGKIIMSQPMWLKFKRNASVQDQLKSFFNIGKTNGTYAPTLDNVNELFDKNGWPQIDVLNVISGVEKDGVTNAYRFFKQENIAFVPAGKLGMLKNAIPMERASRVPGKTYADFGATLVTKWADNDPYQEWTAMEMNAVPAVDIDDIFILKTDTVQASFTGGVAA